MHKNLLNHTRESVNFCNTKNLTAHQKQRRKVNKNVKSNRSHPRQRRKNLLGGKPRTKSVYFEIKI